MSKLLLAALPLAALVAMPSPGRASNHRSAPLITETPKLNATDLYFFRSYETGRSAFVTMIADYIPLQDVYGGPNFFNFDHQAYYDINLDTHGAGVPSMTFRFRFTQTDEKIALNVGGHTIPVALINVGPISAGSIANQNVVETYTVSLVTYTASGPVETPITNAATGKAVFAKPLDDVGDKSIANYAAYAATYIYNVNIPGCSTQGRIFVGQRKEPFVVNLAETFDLINYANPVGSQFYNSAANDLADKNITSLEVEAPISCLVTTDPVVGAWTTASKQVVGPSGVISYQQLSRLGNPLVNELLVGLPDKDRFNSSVPAGDSYFEKYINYPTLPAIIQELFGTAAPTAFPRKDLQLVFLTGIPGLNAPKSLAVPAEEMRLNTSIAPVPQGSQNRLGVIGNDGGANADSAGYPNGRRPGDDVVTISLQVLMGRLYSLGLVGKPANAPSGALDFTDGAYIDDTFFGNAFPYLLPPLSGSPQPAH